ncbi:hypothetical protein F7Q95_05705 [Pseudomonas psychrophila]|nr:hypothetical protein F7Q95_05705 [Pseudomonas psychrophila]
MACWPCTWGCSCWHRRDCGSGLARDTGNAVFRSRRGDAIASKPAPTIAPATRQLVQMNNKALECLCA